MLLFTAALLALTISAALSLVFSKKPAWSAFAGAGGNVLAAALGLAALVFAGAKPHLNLPWAVPGGQFHIALDPLSAVFLAPMFVLCACGALYGVSYGGLNRRTGTGFLLYNLLTASMAVVFTARNAMLFLAAWEIMALCSFLLVVTDYDNPETRNAGWVYLVATHIGTAFIIALFALAWHKCGSTEFADFPKAFASLPFAAVALLSVTGFGAKAGFFPFHVWLPKAHPAAPSHVSAVMSGIMIKTGIYGIIRMISFCPPPPFWFGGLLASIGIISGVGGVLFALAQRDIKRSLAYSSVENIGIIALGLGMGWMGAASGRTDIAFIGFAGALLHVINHAFFKGLLFFGAGAVYHATGIRDMDRLGGLRRFMPVTALTFLAGSAAIAALPPFNGFISEFLIYSGAFKAVVAGRGAGFGGLAVILGLSLTGGLAAACFTRAFGIIFLGEPRAKLAVEHGEPPLMAGPMVALAALCLFIGLAPQFAARLVTEPALMLSGAPYADLPSRLQPAGLLGCAVVLLSLALWFFRKRLLAGRAVASAPTWGCGYSAPAASMQYTASSFAQPLVDFFGIGTAKKIEEPHGLFPSHAMFRSETPDIAKSRFYRPLFENIEQRMSSLRVIQHGNIHAYILYIAAALVALLVWTLK